MSKNSKNVKNHLRNIGNKVISTQHLDDEYADDEFEDNFDPYEDDSRQHGLKKMRQPLF